MGMLKEHLPIERAHMKIQFTLPSKLLKPLKKGMEKYNLVYVKEDFMGANCTVTCNIQPGAYRSLDETLKKLNKYNNLYISEIDVLSMATTIDDNHNNKSNNSSGSNNNKASSDTLIDGFVDLNVHDDEVSTLTFPSKKKNDFSDVIKSYNDDVKNNNIDTF